MGSPLDAPPSAPAAAVAAAAAPASVSSSSAAPPMLASIDASTFLRYSLAVSTADATAVARLLTAASAFHGDDHDADMAFGVGWWGGGGEAACVCAGRPALSPSASGGGQERVRHAVRWVNRPPDVGFWGCVLAPAPAQE